MGHGHNVASVCSPKIWADDPNKVRLLLDALNATPIAHLKLIEGGPANFEQTSLPKEPEALWRPR